MTIRGYHAQRRDARSTDAEMLRQVASKLTYNETLAEAEVKHRLLEIATRIELGYYALNRMNVAMGRR